MTVRGLMKILLESRRELPGGLNQLLIMLCILDAEEPLSQKDIIRDVLISQPSVWRNITLLEDRGLVKADSERRISLTAHGSRLIKHIITKSK